MVTCKGFYEYIIFYECKIIKAMKSSNARVLLLPSHVKKENELTNI